MGLNSKIDPRSVMQTLAPYLFFWGGMTGAYFAYNTSENDKLIAGIVGFILAGIIVFSAISIAAPQRVRRFYSGRHADTEVVTISLSPLTGMWIATLIYVFFGDAFAAEQFWTPLFILGCAGAFIAAARLESELNRTFIPVWQPDLNRKPHGQSVPSSSFARPMPIYDVFISYRRDDSNLILQVADCLQASNLRVWVDQYETLEELDPEHSYDDAVKLRQRIDDGVDKARNYLIFSKKEWSESEYCRWEAQRIRDHLANGKISLANIAEVKMRDDRLSDPDWDYLEQREVKHYFCGGTPQLEDVIRFVKELGWFNQKLSYPIPIFDDASSHQLRFGVNVNLGHFAEIAAGEYFSAKIQNAKSFAGETYFYHGEVNSYRVACGIHINPVEAVIAESAEPILDIDSRRYDIELFNRYVRYANNWLSGRDTQLRGLHIFWINGSNANQNGLRESIHKHSNLCFTSAADTASGKFRRWERQYALMMRNERGASVGEIDIQFSALLPADDATTPLEDRSGLTEFSRLTPTFDAIVQSVRYPTRVTITAPDNLKIVVAKLLWLLSTLVIYDYFRTQSLNPYVHLFTTVLIGLAAQDFLLILFTQQARRHMQRVALNFSKRNLLMPFHDRLLEQIWELSAGSVVNTLGSSLLGVLHPVTIGLVLIGLWQQPVPVWYWVLLGGMTFLIGTLGKNMVEASNG